MVLVFSVITVCQFPITSRPTSGTQIDEWRFRSIYKNHTEETISTLQEMGELLQSIATTDSIDIPAIIMNRITDIHCQYWLNERYLFELPRLLHQLWSNANVSNQTKSALMNKLGYVPVKDETNMKDIPLNEFVRTLIIASREIALNLIAKKFDAESNIISLLYEYCWELLSSNEFLPPYHTIFEYELAIHEYPDYITDPLRRLKILIHEYGLIIIHPKDLTRDWIMSSFFNNKIVAGNVHFAALRKLLLLYNKDKTYILNILKDSTLRSHFKIKMVVKILQSMHDKQYKQLVNEIDKELDQSNDMIVSSLYLHLQFAIQYLCSKSSKSNMYTFSLEGFLFSLKLCDRLQIVKFVVPQVMQEHDDFLSILCYVWIDGKVPMDKQMCIKIAEIVNCWTINAAQERIEVLKREVTQLDDDKLIQIIIAFDKYFRILQGDSKDKFLEYMTKRKRANAQLTH